MCPITQTHTCAHTFVLTCIYVQTHTKHIYIPNQVNICMHVLTKRANEEQRKRERMQETDRQIEEAGQRDIIEGSCGVVDLLLYWFREYRENYNIISK